MSTTAGAAPVQTVQFLSVEVNDRVAIAGVWLVYSFALTIVASALSSQYGFPLDDSYIDLTIARNLAQTGALGLIRGHVSSGATSPLWAVLQSFNFKLLHVDPVIFNLGLGWLMLLAIGTLLFLIARKGGFPIGPSFALAATPALCGNFVWLATIGMEHLSLVLATVIAVWLWQNERWTGLSACSGLLVLIRPEALVLAPVFVIAAFLAKRVLPLKVLAGWGIGIALLFSSNLLISHSLMPTTEQGRSWLWFHENGKHSAYSLGNFLTSYVSRMQFQLPLNAHNAFVRGIQGACLFGLSAWGIVRLLRFRNAGVTLLVALAATHFLVFLLAFPTIGHGGRYQPLFLLLIFPGLYFCPLFSRRTAPYIIAASGLLSLTVWHIAVKDSIGHINETHGQVATWLREHTPDGAVIASYDIGRISYDSNRTVIDLGGLVDPTYLPYLKAGLAPQYVFDKGVSFVVLPSGEYPFALGFTDLYSYEEDAAFCTPTKTWLIGLAYTGNAEQCQFIYRIAR